MTSDDVSLVSKCTGNKKAVFIGISYKGTTFELRGCAADVDNISTYLFEHAGFTKSNSMMLTENETDPAHLPTRKNILKAIRWLVKDAQADDSLVFHYSGHGTKQVDKDGDEVDGMDEVLVPVDFQQAGMITDDDLHAALVAPLPRGVRLTCIMDCCHSGTITDLPFTYNVRGNVELTATKNHKEAGKQMLKDAGHHLLGGNGSEAIRSFTGGLKMYLNPPAEEMIRAHEKSVEERTSLADVISFSGCRDSQTASEAVVDGTHTGAMSLALISTLSQQQDRAGLTYADLLKGMRHTLRGKYTQVPQMSAGRPVDLNTPFRI